jgi:hypothetical protein
LPQYAAPFDAVHVPLTQPAPAASALAASVAIAPRPLLLPLGGAIPPALPLPVRDALPASPNAELDAVAHPAALPVTIAAAAPTRTTRATAAPRAGFSLLAVIRLPPALAPAFPDGPVAEW